MATSRKNPPSCDFYFDDFVAGTYYMDAIEVGMYMRSICFQWNNDSLPNDPETLRRITGVSEGEFAKHWPAVAIKFTTDGNGGLFNERLKSEKAKKLGICESRAEAGRKGGQANAKQMLSKRGSKRGSKNEAKGSWKKEEGSNKKEELSAVLAADAWMVKAWDEWQRHRIEIKKPLTPTQAHKQLEQFEAWGAARSIAAIEYTIAKGWQGLREPDHSGTRNGGGHFQGGQLARISDPLK